ncbi:MULTISPECIES: adenosylmethionine decarboxylase [unclassified Janthinobacterium]|uniref:adenosylmethionine decarboxylase n=1 Tax=unclassified Janthinobacterium TaxID=2610881 RepID=UPI0018C92EA3|nr:adenosylmethionine decarboxylase [Janthinobacterium sp. CG_23.4]MDH6160200.1 S-adenosylmethionine decarboxylase [Janthinobacterium sp. CG_23.4]
MAESPHLPLGTHLLADLSGIAAKRLRDSVALERLLREAAVAAGAQVLHSHFHSFGAGQGITGVVLLAESHISIHTWPECSFAAVDIFMCGAARPQLALDLIKDALQATQCQLQSVRRAPPEHA